MNGVQRLTQYIEKHWCNTMCCRSLKVAQVILIGCYISACKKSRLDTESASSDGSEHGEISDQTSVVTPNRESNGKSSPCKENAYEDNKKERCDLNSIVLD